MKNFESLSLGQKICSINLRATALFAKNSDEYVTVVINSVSSAFHQVYLVLWDKDVRISSSALDSTTCESLTIDGALNEANQFLLSHEHTVIGNAVTDLSEALSSLVGV
jgi:hypothetical protein